MNESRATTEDAGFVADFASANAAVTQGKENLAAVRGITRDQLDGLFQFCYERYLNGDYDTAYRGFQLLCIYDHQNGHNWLGYGYSLLALKDYRKAATSLAFGSLFLEEGSAGWAEAHLYTVRALLHMGQREDARAMLQTLTATVHDRKILSQAAELDKALKFSRHEVDSG